jgi:hypothetical protein
VNSSQDGATLAEALATAITNGVDGVRAYDYAPDNFAPPGVVIGLPEIVFTEDVGTCFAAWQFVIVAAVGRQSDRMAHKELHRLMREVFDALLADRQLGGEAQTLRFNSARPTVISASGAEFPAYEFLVTVYA